MYTYEVIRIKCTVLICTFQIVTQVYSENDVCVTYCTIETLILYLSIHMPSTVNVLQKENLSELLYS